jgi:hypothetical protein
MNQVADGITGSFEKDWSQYSREKCARVVSVIITKRISLKLSGKF